MQANKSRNHLSFKQLSLQTLAAIIIGLLIFTVGSMLVTGTYQIWYAGRIFPGITINNIGVGGMSVEQANNYLDVNSKVGNDGKIILWYADSAIEVEPRQLGIAFDHQSSVKEAYDFGRKDSIGTWLAYQLSGNFSTHNLQPIIIFDQNTAYEFLGQLSLQYDRSPIEANIFLEGTHVTTQLGQTGRQLDISESLERINTQIEELNLGQVVLVVDETTPQILDATPYAAKAQEILNQSITLALPISQADSSREWHIDPEVLAPMLTFKTIAEERQTTIIPQIKDDYLSAYLEELAQQVEIRTENPRFIFNDETGELDLLAEGIKGRSINIETTKAAIQTAMAKGQTNIELAVITQEPEISDFAKGSDLGITELVHAESSYFFGSSEARIQNIETAANQFHGLLVPPNSTFSMADVMDEITIDNGYAEALIIFNGQTIEGVGGGVCQVSTTLFRTAFFAGFPITERHPHAYRVSYYEKTASNKRDNDLAGLDATVYVPLIDLKFVNDTPYWLLMETYVNRSANRLTWKFYSTWDGRTIEWQTSGLTNVEEPEEPVYKENPELPSSEIKQVEWEADGADIRVDRTVYKDDSILFQDTFITQYEPWQAVYECGPDTSCDLSDEEE